MRKRKLLTFLDQFELLKKVKAGVPKEIILQYYDICPATYYRIIERKSEILKNINNFETRNRKSSKKSDEKILDDAVIKWYLQVRDSGDQLSMSMFKKKALELNRKLHGPSKFKASNGWLRNFKKRYCIKNIQMKDGQTSPIDSDAEKFFSDILREKITTENLSLNNIYNADEAGIYWRTSAPFPFTKHKENDILETEERNDRVTSLFCTNASGSHRIPPLIIGESGTHDCLNDFVTVELKDERLKYLENLNVIYVEYNKSWMDSSLFMLWYKNIFIPHVSEHQKSTGITGKVMLILDNAPCHPDLDELNSVHGNFEVVYLPRNVTPVIQPMEQGLISMTKKLYKKNLLRSLLHNDKKQSIEYFSHLNFQEALILLSKSWNGVDFSSLQKAWKSLLGDITLDIKNSLLTNNLNENVKELSTCIIEESSSFPHEICDQLSQRIPSLDCSVEVFKELVLEWFDRDNGDCGWQPLTDKEIINIVTSSAKEIEKEREFENMECKTESNKNYFETNGVIPSQFQDVTFADRAKIDCLKSEENFKSACIKIEVEENENSLEFSDSQQAKDAEYEIERRENEFEDSAMIQLEEVTSLEALKGLMTFKKWMETSERKSKKYYRYIDELKKLISH